MLNRVRSTGIATLGALLVAVPSLLPESPVPGPGGVIMTIDGFVRALDEGDLGTLDQLVGRSANMYGPVRVTHENGKRDLVDCKRPAALFTEVGPDGAVTADTPGAFTKALADKVASAKGRQVRTEILAIHAACPSGAASFGVVEMDRHYTLADGRELTVPIRATALVRYDASKPHHFEIFHWHASKR